MEISRFPAFPASVWEKMVIGPWEEEVIRSNIQGANQVIFRGHINPLQENIHFQLQNVACQKRETFVPKIVSAGVAGGTPDFKALTPIKAAHKFTGNQSPVSVNENADNMSRLVNSKSRNLLRKYKNCKIQELILELER